MKKIIAILAMVLVVVPLLNVFAVTGNYYVYTVGDEVNFYTYKDEEANGGPGTTTTILKDDGADSQYVRVLATGFAASMSVPYCEEIDGDCTIFKNTAAYANTTPAGGLLAQMQQYNGAFENAKPITEEGNLNLITLEELQTVFGATLNGDKYTIDATKWGKNFEVIGGSKNGMYTQSVENVNGMSYVWVVKWTKDTAGKITDIVVERELTNSATTWELVPVIYLDKTYDCVDRETGKEYACYSCDEDYTWTEVGTQAETCSLVENINSKANCVKGPKTGVEEYILPFVAIASVCVVALVVVNRKDLFREI